MSIQTLRGRRGAALALVLAAALALPACSSDDTASGNPGADAQARDESAQQQQAQQVAQANAALPERPSGQVDIDGTNSLSLTRREVNAYQATGTNTVVNLGENGEDRAFQELCSGKIDLVSSMRPISRKEWDACQAVGLDVVQFQIASDAVVIAIASETDVGGDCLTTDQVQEIWRAGSPVTNWSQVGFDDIPLKVGGPLLTSNDFDVFGKSVLGSLAPALTDVRSDYFTYKNFDEARTFLNGGSKRIRLALTYPERARERGQWRSAVVSQKQVYIDARNELRAALANRAKGYRDQRSAADQAKDEARVQAAYVARTKARLKLERYQQNLRAAEKQLSIATKAKRYADATLGHVIYARFSDYEVFEDQLRPFEITEPDGHRNCVFPSQQTITNGDYPFASQVLLTTTTRSLNRKEVQDFIRHYLNAAQESAATAHLVALPDETLRAELAWLDGSREPVLVVPDEDGQISANATETPTPTAESTVQQPAR
ncbi:substrate-binding domain-containing protein [Nocardioides mangrovi]|uniref:Substrate-binding domain-containing protein n=1 Tax=Nocardioides mangrovi TaxID=2874580 RepID=A0ABS7UHR0_9ACTN|nr:substrate-binding domain-containing protein [Nocardioides mangrovi]MBZ5740545.1 substrate-binding domain-containing protein [Nocardioides mangrovi]